jgi:hypothetical protein
LFDFVFRFGLKSRASHERRLSDQLSATSLPAGESFNTVEAAGFSEVLRGVSFTPGTATLTN